MSKKGEIMKLKIGIVGYGNLGKQAEKILIESNHQLVAIFSRRENIKSEFGTKIEKYQNAPNYKDKIDVMLMCGGSKNDIMKQSAEMLNFFNIIDSFDTHDKIQQHKQNLEKISNISKKSAIYSCGWDPGLFSLIRIFETAFLDQPKVYTFWGKGVSQGHSDALRQIDGVEDAIQYTIPASRHIQKIRTDYDFVPQKNEMHIRECFVAIKKGANKKQIEQQIKNMENYFKGQEVQIHFVKKELIEKLKKRMYHAGQIIGSGKDMSAQIRFYVKMKSNPTFTANIMTKYINAIKHLPFGVYSVADIAPKYLLEDYESLL